MAELEGGGENEGQTVIAGGSECVFDFYCEVCRDDGKHLEAAGYCVNCEEYLCETCVSSHKRARPCRFHKILDKSEMPKDTPLSHDREIKTINTRCEAHPGEPVKFYCKDHCEFGCTTCFATGHRTCDEIESIVDKSETVLECGEFKTFIKNLSSMKQTLSYVIETLHSSIAETKQDCQNAVTSVREFRKEIDMFLDEIEQRIITKAHSVSAEEIAKLESIRQEVCALSKKIDRIFTETEKLRTSRRICELYIKMKEMDKEIKVLLCRVSEVANLKPVKRFYFQSNAELRLSLEKDFGLGDLSETMCAARRKYARKVNAKHVCDIDIDEADPNRSNFHIIGSALMPKNRLFICDYTDQTLKMFDTKSPRLLTKLSCKFPFDVAIIDTNKIAVSQLKGNQILLIKVDNEITTERTINIADEARGVAYSKDRLLVTFQQKPRLEVLDLHGKLLKSIQYDTSGKQLFSHPRHVCVSKNDLSIYVSDKDNHKVLSLTFDGMVSSICTKIQAPQKICTDHYGSVFVCGDNANTVHLLSPDLKLIKVLLTQANGLNSAALSVSHCCDTDRLFVGTKSRYLKVYQLS